METVVYAPDVSGFNERNTYYVSWDLSNSPYDIKDTILISGTEPSDWYDYTQGVNHWANVKTTGGGNTDSLQVRVIPNVTGWRGITVNNIFTVCQNLTKTINGKENSLVGSTKDAHMMKNSEWGAVAYLSMSIYGKNSEVWNNLYYNNTTNYSPITGLCGNETNGKDNSTTNVSDTIRYNEEGGGNASTTGNV